MKSTSGLRHCLVVLALATSLAQTGIAAPIAFSKPERTPQARIRSNADVPWPQKELLSRIKRAISWVYDELSIPRP
jgi:hypothetical protein